MTALAYMTLILSIIALALDVWLVSFIIKGFKRKEQIDKELDKLTTDITKQIIHDNFLRNLEEAKFNKEENKKNDNTNN